MDLPKDAVYIDSRKITLQSDHIVNSNIGLAVRLVPNLDIDVVNYPSIHLAIRADEIEADKIWTVIPRVKVLNGTVDFLKEAILAGVGKQANIVMHAAFTDSPHFSMDGSAQVSNATVRIDPEWALLENINATVVLHGKRVSFEQARAATKNLSIWNGIVEIDRSEDRSDTYHGYVPIWIEAEFAGTFENGINFLKQSPVWVDIKDGLEDAVPGGNIEGNLEDFIVFIPPNDSEVEVTGDVHVDFVEGELTWPEMYIPIKNMSGTLTYSGDKAMSSSGLRGEFYGNEMNIELSGDRPITEDFAKHTVKAKSKIGAETLFHWMEEWNKFLEGESDFTAVFEIVSHESWSPLIDIETDFRGMHFYLPIPMGKTKDTPRPTSFKILVEDSNEETVRFWFQSLEMCGDVLAGDNGMTGDIFISDDQSCEQEKLKQPSLKVAKIRGELPFADASSWADFIRETPVDNEPIRIEDIIDFDIALNIDEIALTSMIIKNTSIIVTSDDVAIYVDGTGDHLSAKAIIPSDKSQIATGNVSMLLTDIAATPEQWSWTEDPLVPKWTSFDPDNLQPFDIKITNFGSVNHALGSARIYTSHRPKEVDVLFEFDSPDIQARNQHGKGAKLTWKLYDNQLTTGLDMDVDLSNSQMNGVFAETGFDKFFVFDTIRYQTSLVWNGDVTDINTDSLFGNFTMNVHNFYLGKNITKEFTLPSVIAFQASRFIDIFSVFESIFTLNFKGLQWQNITQGLFQLRFEPRTVFADNLIVESNHIVSARGVLTDLLSSDSKVGASDLTIFLKPNVSASLPLLWATACGPACLLPLLLINQIVSINDESIVGLKLFGPLDDLKVIDISNRIDSGDIWVDNSSREVFILPAKQ